MKEIDIRDPESKLIRLCTTTDAVKAELIRNTLLDHDIKAEVDGEHQAGFTGTIEIGILVRESDAKFAREVLENHHLDD